MPVARLRKRDRHARADDLLEDRGVGGQPRGDLGRAVLLEEARRQGQQILLHRDPQVGDGALADPRHEVEAQRGRQRQHDDDHQQILEGLRRPLGACRAVAAEAAVDDPLEAIRDGQRRRRGQAEEEQRGRDLLADSCRRRARSASDCRSCRALLSWVPAMAAALAARPTRLKSPAHACCSAASALPRHQMARHIGCTGDEDTRVRMLYDAYEVQRSLPCRGKQDGRNGRRLAQQSRPIPSLTPRWARWSRPASTSSPMPRRRAASPNSG